MELCECSAFLLDDEIEHCLNGLCSDCCEEDHLANDKKCMHYNCSYSKYCNVLKAV